MGRTIGRVLVVAAISAVAATIIWSVLPRPIPVETSTVTKGRFTATVDEDGKTRIRERYIVAAPLGGRLTRVRLKVGDQVHADDVVATIVPSPAPFLDPRSRDEAGERLGTAEAALDRATAMVERAGAQAEQANKDLERTRRLSERGVSSAQELERSELAVRVADRDVRAADFQKHAADHEVSQARALLAQYGDNSKGPVESWAVTAPVTGLVLKVTQESETIIQPGAPIVEIGDLHDLEIVVDVLSRDAVEIRRGAEVTIEHWGGAEALAGRVRRVEPAAFTKISTLGVEEQRVNVLVDITSAPGRWIDLGDGYQVDARVVVFSRDGAIIVPAGALFRRGDNWNVFVVDAGRVEVREITLLRRSGRFAAVAAGLSPGERVIVYPSDRIAPGVWVEFR
jgi:HlyD family secretion protein